MTTKKIRRIAPEMWRDSFFVALPMEFRLLWIGLITAVADDQGRLQDDAAQIKLMVFPADKRVTADMVERGLNLFMRRKKIYRYMVGNNGTGKRVIQISKWWEHQRGTGMHFSQFPPPPPAGPFMWVDRINSFGLGSNNPIQNPGWNTDGGWMRRPKNWREVNTPVPMALRHRNGSATVASPEHIDIHSITSTEDEKDSLPPFPPSSQDDPKAAGRHGTVSKNAPSMHQLNAQQRKSAERIQKIFAVASFRDKRRAVLISVLVATRIVGGDPITSRVIPAFATAYSDSKVKDPTAVAVSRLENDQHNSAFEDPKTWRSVPLEVLQAAGITDLAAYKIERFRNGG